MRVRASWIILIAAAAALAAVFFRSSRAGPVAVMARGQFQLADAGSPDARGAGFGGGARVNPGDAGQLWGSLVGGNEFVGELVSPAFQILGDALVVPVAGYPSAEGNSLRLEILADGGGRFAEVKYLGDNPGEAIRLWRIPVGQWWKMRARLVLQDGRKTDEAWLAIGLPIAEHVDPNP